MFDLNLNNEDPTVLKTTFKDDETKELKYKTEIHDLENILKSFEIDNKDY